MFPTSIPMYTINVIPPWYTTVRMLYLTYIYILLDSQYLWTLLGRRLPQDYSLLGVNDTIPATKPK